MEPAELAMALEELAARIGVEVRHERFDRPPSKARSGGGLCKVKGKLMIIREEGLGAAEKVVLLSEEISRFNLQSVEMAPEVRAAIGGNRRQTRADLRPLARTKARRPTVR
jgi:hypothetical protein